MDLQTIAQGQTTYALNSIQSDRALVQSIQVALNKMGFYGSIANGVWSRDTAAAYQRFAQAYGFRSDGISPRIARFILYSVGVPLPAPAPTPTPRPVPVPVPIPIPVPVPSPGGDIFAEALRFSLRWEGGYANNPADIGGETNKGVTTNTYAAYRRKKGVSSQSVKYVTDEEVYEIYRDMYWKPAQCDLAVRPLAIVHFDTAVNFGVGGATLFLQEVLGVTADGAFGPGTRAALQQANSIDTAKRYCQARIDYRYRRITQNASQRVFLTGWLNRDNDLLKYISGMG